MSHRASIRLLCGCGLVGLLASAASPAFAANYTWKTLSGTGNWTDSLNWSGTSATNLYPGSVGSGTADFAGIQAMYTSAPTINLDTSVTIRQLNVGGTTGSVTYPVTLSTSNGSTLTMTATTVSGTGILAVNSAVSSGTNVITPDIIVAAATWETRMASVTTGTVNALLTGNISGGLAGSRTVRYTPNNTSTTTAPSFLEFRGNITDGAGTVVLYYRCDMPNSTNTLRLSGTGNTFTGGFTYLGGKSSILESSPMSGTNGALGTGLLTVGASGSNATLNLGGSLSTVTEVCGISIRSPGTVAKRIAVIGAGSRILSGAMDQSASAGLTLACERSGSLTFSNAISGNGPITVNSTGSGKVIFTGNSSTYSGATTVQAGGLQLGSGPILGTSTITPLAGGTLSLQPYAQTSVGGLAPNAGGLTDVTNGSLTVPGLSVADMLTALNTGRNGGAWDGASGITSSDSAASGGARTVGWLDNGGSVTFAYAAAGDTNLDWFVDVQDAANFVASGKYGTGDPATWIEGDFTYDGVVDVLDAAEFAVTGLYGGPSYNSPSGGAGGIAAVPEPSSLGVIGMVIAAAAVVGRRR